MSSTVILICQKIMGYSPLTRRYGCVCVVCVVSDVRYVRNGKLYPDMAVKSIFKIEL